MTGQLSAQVLEIIRKMQQNELTESVIYEKIAVFAKGEENRQTLLRLSREERAQYEIWKKPPASPRKSRRRCKHSARGAQRFISVTLKPWRTDAIGHWMAKTSGASEAERTWF